ncbi:MAG: tetratricopeptide repeat protein [Deltaproteobacteria bacterium]|nr:tetratricopeptide repeat protein [Deltaproteobacteria bacterium]
MTRILKAAKRNTCISAIILILLLISLSGCGGIELIKADMQMAGEQYAPAIQIYREYLTKNSDSIEARNKLGFAYLKTGQLDDSIEEFETVLRLEPGNCYAILYLGMAYLNKGDPGKAITTLQAYRNTEKPLVEAEIKRLLTVVQIAESQRLAREALAQEAKLKAKKPDSNTVSVCYYEDLSPENSLRAFQKGLAAMLITDMSKIKSLRVVERLRIQSLFQEMRLGQTGIIDESTAPRVGHLLGAEHLVTGNLAVGSIRTTTSLVSASMGKVTGSSTVDVEKEKFYELPRLIIENFASIKGIELSPEEKKAIGIPHTKNYEAFNYYGEGLNALDEGKWQDAKDLFEKALKLDPQFDLAMEGFDSTPSPSSPTTAAIANMSVPEISELVETSINTAETEQEQTDEEAEASMGGSGGY